MDIRFEEMEIKEATSILDVREQLLADLKKKGIDSENVMGVCEIPGYSGVIDIRELIENPEKVEDRLLSVLMGEEVDLSNAVTEDVVRLVCHPSDFQITIEFFQWKPFPGSIWFYPNCLVETDPDIPIGYARFYDSVDSFSFLENRIYPEKIGRDKMFRLLEVGRKVRPEEFMDPIKVAEHMKAKKHD